MGHEIHLEKKNLRTDLIIENLENRKEKYEKEREGNVIVTDIVLDEKQSKELGKKKETISQLSLKTLQIMKIEKK